MYVTAKGVVDGDQISPSATFILEGPSILGPSPDQINNLGNTTRENGLHTQEEKTRTMDEEDEGTRTRDKQARTQGWMMFGGNEKKQRYMKTFNKIQILQLIMYVAVKNKGIGECKNNA